MNRFAVVFFLPLLMLPLCCLLITGCLTSSKDKEPEISGVEVDTEILDFGEAENTMYFNVITTGDETNWEIANGDYSSWCTVQVERRTDGGHVTVTVNRSSISPGEHTTSIVITWNSGSQAVQVRINVPETGKDTGTVIIDMPIPENEEVVQ